LPINAGIGRFATGSDLSTAEDVDGRIQPKYKEKTLNNNTITIATNIKKGTMIILHSDRVN
jgi:hypothetical protein